jgi:hypothetical protein
VEFTYSFSFKKKSSRRSIIRVGVLVQEYFLTNENSLEVCFFVVIDTNKLEEKKKILKKEKLFLLDEPDSLKPGHR